MEILLRNPSSFFSQPMSTISTFVEDKLVEGRSMTAERQPTKVANHHHHSFKPPRSPPKMKDCQDDSSSESVEAFVPVSPTSTLHIQEVQLMWDRPEILTTLAQPKMDHPVVVPCLSPKPRSDDTCSIDTFLSDDEDEEENSDDDDNDEEEELLGLCLLTDDFAAEAIQLDPTTMY